MLCLLLLCVPEPTGLQAALESADSVEAVYQMTGEVVTLKGDDLKKLAKLVRIDGRVRKAPGWPATLDIIEINIRKGEKTSTFFLIRQSNLLLFGEAKEQMAILSDADLGAALKNYFSPP